MVATKTLLSFLVSLGCGLTFAYSPQPARAAAPAQAPVTRVTTRLVQVNVVAQDKKGQPVTDLTRDDFEITEQGKPQKISVFSIESNQKAVGRAGPLAANTYSNLPSRSGASQNFTVILFDSLNTPAVDQANAKREVLRFLQQVEAQDRVAIYGLGAKLRVVHDFTGNSEALVRAIARFKTGVSPDQVSSRPAIEDNTLSAADDQEKQIIAAMDAFLNESSQLVANYYIERRMAITLQALESISNHLASLPGRKCLVWISASFPFSYGSDTFQVNRANEGSRNFLDFVARATRSITDANVAIYPVDARGFLSAAALNPSSSAASVVTSAKQPMRTDSSAMDEMLSAHNTMQELAQRTGGRAIYGTDEVRNAIRRALEDSRVTYTLGYYPTDEKFNGKFRAIKISVKRQGVQLMHRRGYFAFPNEALDEAGRQSAINNAARSLLDATGIGFSVVVGKPASGNSPLQLALDVDPTAVTLEPQQDLYAGALDIVFAQLDSQGNVVTSNGRQVPVRLTAPQRQQLLEQGLVLNAPVDLNARSEQLRIIVRDARSGTVGTLTIPLKQ